MSFDIFLGFFQGGEASSVPRAAVEQAFEAFIERREPGCLTISFSDGGFSEVFLGDAPEIGGFMVATPPSSDEFWTALGQVMEMTKGVLYWPGGGAVVTDAATIAHLPEDMIQTLGMPAVVSDPSELRKHIR